MSGMKNNRKLPVVWINPELNDLPLSPEAFRLYFYLVCQTHKGEDLPVIKVIGSCCFPNLEPKEASAKVTEAAMELREWGVLYQEKVNDFTFDIFCLADSSEWKRPGGEA